MKQSETSMDKPVVSEMIAGHQRGLVAGHFVPGPLHGKIAVALNHPEELDEVSLLQPRKAQTVSA